ncbi:hypothetical protein C5167_024487 [Papaver somniferum]|uniref:Uncharacterized protein n=1 Tax=Papaver somniferum TaxID=3469 RepID=A0A4Y7JQB7_PAPSO|nr:hypothetical protein C5167_024487 [Papaver somniferum]
MHAKADLYKHNDELANQLEHMEQKLEELLDIVVSKCRKLPEGGRSFYEMNTGLDKEVETAKRLSLAELQQVLMEIKVVSKLEPLPDNITSDPDVNAQTAPVQYYATLIQYNKPGVAAFRMENGYGDLRDALDSYTVRFQSQIVSDSAIQTFQQI